MVKINLKESAWLALPVTVAVYVVSWLFGILGIGTTPLFSAVPSTSVVTGTVGTKVLSFIGGILPFSLNFGTIITVYLSAVVGLIIGSFLIGQFNLPAFKNFLGFNGNSGKIASTLMWGALPVYLILVGFKIPPIMSIVGILVHTVAVSLVAVWLANLVKLKI